MCWLGGNLIVNGYANESIRRVFERGGSLREGVAVEITPDDGPAFAACVEGNPFGRGLVSLLLKHHAEESGGAFVKRLIFISGEGAVRLS